MRRRRALLRATGAALAGGLAGCVGGADGGTPTPSGDCTITEESTVSDLPVPVAGDPDAAVTVAAFEDFSCPHCRRYNAEVYPRLRSNYVEPGDVRYEHHDFPIPVDPRWSWWVASAARGVQDAVGDEAFFAFKRRAFQNQGEYTLPLLGDLAADAGAGSCAVQNDAANEVYRPVLEADKRRGIDRGVQATPTVYVDGESVDPNYEAVASAIDAAM